MIALSKKRYLEKMMKNFYRILILLFFSIPLIAADATVSTRDWVISDTGDILLGEIADVFGVNRLLVAKLNSAYLCDPPGKGESLRLTRADIRRKLQHSGIDLSTVIFAGSYETVIAGETVNDLADNPIAKTVTEFLHRYFAKTGEEFDLHFRHIPELSKGLPDDCVFKVISNADQTFRGNVVMIVAAVFQGRTVKKYPVSLKIKVYKEVLVALNTVDRGSLLNPANFELVKREITMLRESPVDSFDELINQQAARVIGKNSILTWNEKEPVPAIKQGDIITITLQADSFHITARGRARKSGGVGETIPVVNLSSLKEIDAVVIDSNTVAVEY